MLFAALLAVWVGLSLFVVHQPFHVGRRLRYFDLRVYRDAASLILNGGSLYDTRLYGGLHFTYPPIAALTFTPLALFPLALEEILVTALNVAALIWLLRRALEIHVARALSGTETRLRGRDKWAIVGLATAAALWLEPVTTTLGYGQVDLVIAALIVFDLSRADTAKSKGAALGLAAGLKLTPLLFVPYLLFTRRRRAAAVAGLVFAGTVALGFAVLPSDAARYWGRALLDPSRVGRVADWANQSLDGAIARLTGTSSVGSAWFAAVAVLAAVGLAGAVLAGRRGDEATGFSLCALTALLVSPISWTHHWVLAVPALFLFVLSAYERGSRPRLIAATAIAAIGYSYIPQRVSESHILQLKLGGLIASDAYVLIGLVAIATGCAAVLRAAPAARRNVAVR
ncbi:MAG TPA: glycosyltransferase 87 family protein [Solirubrobacteraceae bacterium]